MILTRAVKFFSESLLSLAYPQPCVLCGSSVEKREFGIACESCWQSTKLFTGCEAVCSKCGVTARGSVAANELQEVRCHRCDELWFTGARACGVYEGALRESVLKLKREPHLSKHLINLLVENAGRPPLDICTRVLPVPIHPKRRQGRGFNQAAVIASAVAGALQLPLDEVSLVRTSLTDKYRAGLDAKGRHETVAGAFEIRYPSLVKAEDILLVDDVLTTGATVSSCGEVLLAAGARTVFVLTIARPAY